jgi:hypothetical protein
MFKSPCIKDGKHCEKRTVGCHSVCKEYIEAEAKYKAAHAEYIKQRKAETMFANYYCDAIVDKQRGNKFVKRKLGKR